MRKLCHTGDCAAVEVFVIKPDGIGDFVLATGAIRVLAREYGEENLTLCVKTILVPLARNQFPRATIWELPTASERKVLNLFVWNFLVCLPLWWRLRQRPFGAAVCFRSMRNYLETFLFYSARAPRHLACENILLRGGRKVRTAVEKSVVGLLGPELVPYPDHFEELPLEIEANRVVVEKLLGRTVSADDVRPDVRAARPGDQGAWVCAPVTNLASKVYPFAKWQAIFEELRAEAESKVIRLVGVPADVPKLEPLRDALLEAGFSGVEIHLPPDLAAFVQVIADAELVLTVDTAAAHFATALDRPTVVIFSGLHRGMFGPWRRSSRQEWLEPAPVPAGTKKTKWHKSIPPTRAATAVRTVLAAHESCSS